MVFPEIGATRRQFPTAFGDLGEEDAKVVRPVPRGTEAPVTKERALPWSASAACDTPMGVLHLGVMPSITLTDSNVRPVRLEGVRPPQSSLLSKRKESSSNLSLYIIAKS